MKNSTPILGAIIFATSILASCGQTDNKQKELELKEREIALKEKEIALKQKESIVSQAAQSNPDLSGEWKGSGGVYQLTISKNGNTYTIIWHGSIHRQTYSGKYENGKINVGGGIVGDPTYSEDTNKISWMGEEWRRISTR